MKAQAKKENISAQEVTLSDDRGISDKLIPAAIVVGLLLTAVGGGVAIIVAILTKAYTPGTHIAVLIMCCGLAVILAAFGGRAAGTWRGWALTGAAALAFGLFLLQWYLQPQPKPASPALRGTLQGTQSFQQISMWSFSPMFITRRRTRGSFEFAAFPDDLERVDTFYLNITNMAGESPQEFYIYCVPSSILSSHFGDITRLDLSIRKEGEEWKLFDRLNKGYGQHSDDCGAPTRASTQKGSSIFNFGLSSAFAQTPDSAQLDQLILDLNASDSDARASARHDLSLFSDKESLRRTTESWNTMESSYRDDLGRLVAWNWAIKNNKTTASNLVDVLGRDKTNYLIALSGYPDQTMRSQANSLLRSLMVETAPSRQKPNSQTFFKQVLDTIGNPQSVTTDAKKKGIQFSPNLIGVSTLQAVRGAQCGAVNAAASQTAEIVQAVTSPGARGWLSGDKMASALADDIQKKKCP
jgi:hypothetical protein